MLRPKSAARRRIHNSRHRLLVSRTCAYCVKRVAAMEAHIDALNTRDKEGSE